MLSRFWPRLCLAILSIASAADVTAADPKRAESYLGEAAKSLQKNDLKTAVIQLKNAVQSDPGNGKARFELGVVQLQLGELSAAETQLRAALERKYDPDKVAAPLADTLLRLERNQELLDEIAAGERPAELEAAVRVARGYALLNLRRVEEAMQSFAQAEALAAKPAAAQFGLARALGFSRDVAAALEMLKKALDGDPKLVEGWIFFGQLQRAQGDTTAAKASLDRAIALSPNSAVARLDRASLLIAMNELAGAEADIANVFAANPQDPLAHYLQALVYANRQNYRAAEISLQSMKAGLYAYPPATYLIAAVNLAQDQLAQAEDNISRFLTRVPNDEAGTALFATLLLRRNTLPRAIDFLKGAIDANPTSIRLLGLLSEAYVRSNQPQAAAAIIERISTLSPKDAALKTQLAAQRLRIGQASAALDDLEAATALAPRSAEAGLLLVLTYLDANRIGEARKAAETMRSRIPDDPLPENLLGAIASRAGDAIEARAHYQAALKIRADYLPAQINLGQLFLAERKFADARGTFDAILARDPANPAALMAEVELSLAEGKKDDAVRWLEKARAADASSLEPRFQLVEAYIGRAEPDKAAAIAGELDKLTSDDPRAVSAIGAARLANNEIAPAIAAFDRLVQLAPNSTSAQLQRARAYYAAKDADKARAALERAAEIDPGDPEVERQLTRLAIETDTVEGELVYLKALAAAKRDDPAYDFLAGNLAMSVGRAGEAEALLLAGLAKRENNPILLARLAQAQAQSDGSKAVKTLADWLQKYPDTPEIRLTLANMLLDTKRNDEAIAAYEAVLAAQPDNVSAANNLAWLYQLKKDGRAVGLAEAAYKRVPGNPDIADTLAWILVLNGENARGLALLEKVAASPTAPLEMRYHLAVALKNAGRAGEARRTLEAVLGEGRRFDSVGDAQALLKQLAGG
jgi:putative PEP-CTERM system TPR-repeat lipoprotein